MVNIRQKGGDAEREIRRMLNDIIIQLMTEMQFPQMQIAKYYDYVQRNQNQSAVGGADLVGTFEFAIEIKRQEKESLGVWWEQCRASAEKISKRPVLLWKRNYAPWKCMLLAPITAFSPTVRNECAIINCPVQISIEAFKLLFREVAIQHFLTVPIE